MKAKTDLTSWSTYSLLVEDGGRGVGNQLPGGTHMALLHTHEGNTQIWHMEGTLTSLDKNCRVAISMRGRNSTEVLCP